MVQVSQPQQEEVGLSQDRYIEEAKRRLRRLSKDIEDVRSQVTRSSANGGGFDHSTLSETWDQAEAFLGRLKASGEEQWTELRGGLDLAVRELGTMTERARQSLDRALAEEGETIARYYLGPIDGNGWALKKEGVEQVTKHFASKREGLSFSRRYVRGQKPSELVVRRRDGTFETRHRYS